MATIRPFRGLRFDAKAGAMRDVVAPPYDVLSQAERDAYAAKSEHNIVHLTLPEHKADDRSKFVKYARSAARLEQWRREGAIAAEGKAALYRYTQTFEIPGTGQTLTRTALVALIKVEPYENGVVLPHEQTFPKHKEDRLRILEATRSHLECIFGLFEDDDRTAFGLVSQAPAILVADFTTPEDGIRHQLEVIEDATAIDAIVGEVADKKVWIADGHHRYETALTFRGAQAASDGALIAEDFMMMALCSISDPGLVLLPTHRILRPGTISAEEVREKLSAAFPTEACPNARLMARIEELQADGTTALGVALPGGDGLVLKVGGLADVRDKIAGPGSDLLKDLDVSILHGHVFGNVLGLVGHEFFGYTRVEQEALAAVEVESPAAFLMNPPTVDDMRQIALGGEKMPQKSTYYYPKLLSGLVVWSLKDFEE